MLAYTTIALTGLAGLAGLPWYSILAGGCVLALLNIIEEQKLRSRYAAVGGVDVISFSALANLSTGCIAAAAAFTSGTLINWFLRLI